MPNTNPMVGMGNQMVPPYGATMQNQMGTMGMGPQVVENAFNMHPHKYKNYHITFWTK